MLFKTLNINDFDYNLSEEKIAKYPLKERDNSKLLHFDGKNIEEKHFLDLPQLLDAEDLLVCNNTKVIQARLHFAKKTGSFIEIFILEPHYPADYQLAFQSTKSCVWKVFIGNAKRWKSDILTKQIVIDNECNYGFEPQLPENISYSDFCQNEAKNQKFTFSAKYLQQYENMSHLVEFQWDNKNFTFGQILENFGELPIPPYLNRKCEESDKKTYQTIYSKIYGSVASPTAGLHFTTKVLHNLANKGVKISEITLHVGAGTFQPIKSEKIGGHKMHGEFFKIQLSVIEQIIKKIDSIVAVGTTSVRTLESLYFIGCHIKKNPQNPQFVVNQWEEYETEQKISVAEALQEIVNYMKINHLQTICAETKIIIVPSFNFKIVKKIITNFHQPKSTLLLLVSAFAGEENRKKIYEFALKNDFRFLSYGDSSLLEQAHE
jgi:S-adenosylmethionine:tRNA ribosyltransferase-isomerase